MRRSSGCGETNNSYKNKYYWIFLGQNKHGQQWADSIFKQTLEFEESFHGEMQQHRSNIEDRQDVDIKTE